MRRYLERHLPDLVEFGSLLNPLLDLSLPQSEVVASLDAQARRAEALRAGRRASSTEAARERAHVIVVEDLHWMDESSLALVRTSGERVGRRPVLLLLTTRPDRDVRWRSRPRRRRALVLAELTEPESLAMVREALGVADLPAEVGEAIYAKTKGNPLFLEEVVHSLQAPGVLERILSASSVTRAAELAALEIPDRVQGLLMSRIDRLPPDTREVLKAGSVVGRSFDERVLAAIDDELLRAVSLERAFDELLAAALVVPDDDGGRAVGHLPPRPRPGRRLREPAVRAPARPARRVSRATSRRRRRRPTTACSCTTTPRGRRGEDAAPRGARVGVVGRRLREPRGHRLSRRRARHGHGRARRGTPVSAAGSRS